MHTPLNEPLFRQIQAQITSHPERYYQNTWGTGNACDTVCCLAGWAALLAHPGSRLAFQSVITSDGVTLGDVWDVAATALGLGTRDSDTLFSLDEWLSRKHREQMGDALSVQSDDWIDRKVIGSPLAAAQVASDYLDWYLENDRKCQEHGVE